MANIVLTKHGKRRFRQRVGHNSFLKTLNKVLKEGELVQSSKKEMKFLKDKFLFVFDNKEEREELVLVTVLKTTANNFIKYSKGVYCPVERKTQFQLAN
jgi:hypothetical protein